MPIGAQDLDRVDALRRSIDQVIVGKQETVKLLVTAVLARGHVLFEDNPGLGKTSIARALARAIDGKFRRVQFTPDLLPADVTGFSVLDRDTGALRFQEGPVFASVLLADEINRATPRTQSALLEAMGEGRVTVDGTTRALPQPFIVVATQNPLEYAGTYPLPEAQLDRFLMLLRVGYPTPEEEVEILQSRRKGDPIERMKPVLSAETVAALSAKVEDVRVEPSLTRYIVDLVGKTRAEKGFTAGASPRGALALSRAAQAFALVLGRDHVVPDDVQALVPHVLAHRIVEKRARASSEGRAGVHLALRKIVESVAVPE